MRDPPSRRGKPFRVLLYNVDNGGEDDSTNQPEVSSFSNGDWLKYLTSPEVSAVNPIPWTASSNASLGRPSDWFALRKPHAPGSMATALKDAKNEMSGRLGSVLSFIRGREADVVAVVEANGWERRRRRASSSSNRRFLQVAEPDGLRQRAKAAGFPFGERLSTPSKYNVALLSRTPIRVLGTEGGADATHFERGILAADVGQAVVVVAHLHAHESSKRREEAALLAKLVRRLETDHRKPVVVAGDMNSLSPLDRSCHADLHIEGFIKGVPPCPDCHIPDVPDRLKDKYLFKKQDGSFAGIDYSPLQTLAGDKVGAVGSQPCEQLAASGENEDSAPLIDLLAFEDSTDWLEVQNMPGYSGTERMPRRCIGTQPTGISMLGQVPPEQVLPFRLDYVYASREVGKQACELGQQQGRAVAAGYPKPLSCRVVANELTFGISDHFPVECDLSWDVVWSARESMLRQRGSVSARAKQHGVRGAVLDALDRGSGSWPSESIARRLGGNEGATGGGGDSRGGLDQVEETVTVEVSEWGSVQPPMAVGGMP